MSAQENSITVTREVAGLSIEFRAERIDRLQLWSVTVKLDEELYDTFRSDDVFTDVQSHLSAMTAELLEDVGDEITDANEEQDASDTVPQAVTQSH